MNRPTITAVLATAAATATFMVGMTHLWDWVTAPKHELVAAVEFGPFLQIPQMRTLFESFEDLRDKDALVKSIPLERIMRTGASEETKDAIEELLWDIAAFFRERVPSSVPYESQVRGIWRVRVSNDGSRPLSDVAIMIPNARFASIWRDGVEQQIGEPRATIVLGAIRPLESVDIVCWASLEPTRSAAREIRVSHAEGIGSVRILAPVGAVGQWVDQNLLVINVVVGFVLMLILLGASTSMLTEKITAQGSEQRSDGNASREE